MSVQPVEVLAPAVPVRKYLEPTRAQPESPRPVQDHAEFSAEARQLAARLTAEEEAIKLHLSPRELAALISPPESEVAHTD